MTGLLALDDMLGRLREARIATVSTADPGALRKMIFSPDAGLPQALDTLSGAPRLSTGTRIFGHKVLEDARLPPGVAVLHIAGARPAAVLLDEMARPAATYLADALAMNVPEKAIAFKSARPPETRPAFVWRDGLGER
ncbi:MAG: hypothetical protein AAGA06_08055 [Pseudomonadota bacterium]